MKLKISTHFSGVLLLLLISTTVFSQRTAQEINAAMGRGINLGNTLEAPNEGEWNNNVAKETNFEDFKAAGFTCVRVPVCWDKHTSNTSPYAINATWMNRVEEVIDWGLDRGLYIVLNAHHEDWIKTGYASQNLRDRFDSIWSQISVRFKDKSDHLLFEMINEPNGLTKPQIDELNKRVLGIIRKTNPTRVVLFSGNMWANSNELITAAIPDPNDPYLIGYFHSYDPWNFAGESQGTWGTVADRNALKSKFDEVQAWSEKNNIPVTINEFGAMHDCDFNSRMYHYASYTEEALNHNFSFNVWDDNGWFQLYRRNERKWNDMKDIVIYTSSTSPTILKIIGQDSLQKLTWTNRAENADSFYIERRPLKGTFKRIAALPTDSAVFYDSGLEVGKYYDYRVIDHYNDSIDIPSYPLRTYINPYIRNPFQGEAFPVPGIIEAEDYDEGGEGLTYHDTDPANTTGAYRPNDGVDIETRTDGYQLSYVEVGEWIEYTIDVAEEDDYLLTAYVASQEGGGRISLMFGTSSTFLDIPSTGNWTTLTTVSKTRHLSAGEQIMRLRILALPAFNIDKFEISSVKTAVDELAVKNLKVYSTNNKSVVLSHSAESKGSISFYSINGQLIENCPIDFNYNEYRLNTAGTVLYRVIFDNGITASGKVLIQ